MLYITYAYSCSLLASSDMSTFYVTQSGKMTFRLARAYDCNQMTKSGFVYLPTYVYRRQIPQRCSDALGQVPADVFGGRFWPLSKLWLQPVA